MSLLSQVYAGATSAIFGQNGLQDWRHASKVFADGDMFRAPKFKGMFHVSFVFNDWEQETQGNTETECYPSPQSGFKQVMNAGSGRSDILSVLTKAVDLPKFNVQYTTHNQYNKTTHTMKKMKYEPISMTFHDDMNDYVWGLWAFYYNWYFADGIKGYSNPLTDNPKNQNKLRAALATAVKSVYQKITGKSLASEVITVPRSGTEWDASSNIPLLINTSGAADSDITPARWTSDQWGLNGTIYQSQSKPDKALHLLKAIEIYPLGNKKASTIVLHNPKIIGWDHDTFDYSSGSQTATCRAQIVYEGVSYLDQVNSETIMNTVTFFDKHASPLMSGAPRTLLGPGGVLDRTIGVLGNIANGNLSVQDIFTTAAVAQSLSNKKLVNGTSSEISTAVNNSVRNISTANVINKKFPGTG